MADPFPLLERKRREQVLRSFYDYRIELQNLIDILVEEKAKAIERDTAELNVEPGGSDSFFLVGKVWETDDELRERSRQSYLKDQRATSERRAQYEKLKKEFES